MAPINDTELGTHEWWESYKETVNSDPEMNVRGHHQFSENFYVEIGDERVLLEMDGGEIENLVPNPTMNHQWSFGVEGDLYYSVDHDYRDKLDQVNADECPIYIASGEYDYLTTPEDGRQTAEGIGEGATAIEFAEIGHFPMSEHPELFNAYITEVLADVTGDRDEELPDVLEPNDVEIELHQQGPAREKPAE